MYDESNTQERVRARGSHLARFVVPAGFAVVTWLIALIGVGLVARLDSPSLLNLFPLFIVAVMFWPIYLAAPWRPGLTERVRLSVRANERAIAAAAVLLVARSVPFTPDVLRTLLDFPFRSAGMLFGAGLFYRRLIAPEVGRFVLSFGQWYLELFWLLIVGSVLAKVALRLRSAVPVGTGR